MKMILEIDTSSLEDMNAAQKHLDFARAQLRPGVGVPKSPARDWAPAIAAAIHEWLLKYAKESVRLSTAYYKVTDLSLTDLPDARRRVLLRELATRIQRHTSSAASGATVVFMDAAGNYDTETK